MILKGIVRSFNPVTCLATVQVVGSTSHYLEGVKVAANIPGAEVFAGRQCAVLIFDAGNPDDAVVMAVWD